MSLYLLQAGMNSKINQLRNGDMAEVRRLLMRSGPADNHQQEVGSR